MKKRTIYLIITVLLGGCTANNLFEQKEKLVSHLSSQLGILVTNSANDTMVPGTFEAGKYAMLTKNDWCSGFPAGSYWYMFELTGDPKYRNAAIAHANTTLANHFRQNMSSFHVVNYDTTSGQPIAKFTVQGLSDNSAWARGQG